MADLVSVITSSIFIGLFILLFGLFLYQSIKKQRRAYMFTFSLFLGILAGILSIIDLLATDWGLAYDYFSFYSLVIGSIGYYLIYLFFEQLVAVRPNRIRLSISSVLLILSIVFNQLFFYLYHNPGIVSVAARTNELLWDFSYDALGVFIFLFGAFVHISSYKRNRDALPLIQAIALVWLSAGFVLGFIADVISVSTVGLIGELLKIFGLLVFTLVYVIRIDFIYRLPVSVYFVLTFTNTGLNIHISRIRTAAQKTASIKTESDLFNEKILSGIIIAISNLLQETLGSTKRLERIVTGDRTIILNSGELATCAILCDKSTFFLERSLKDLRKLIERKFEKSLQKPAISVDDFSEMDEIIEEVFPFLIVEQVQD